MSPSSFSNRPVASAIQPASSEASACTDPNPDERLQRLAALVAIGETSLPDGLESAELSRVLSEVARLRREQLVRVVARAIVLDLRRSRE